MGKNLDELQLIAQASFDDKYQDRILRDFQFNNYPKFPMWDRHPACSFGQDARTTG